MLAILFTIQKNQFAEVLFPLAPMQWAMVRVNIMEKGRRLG